MDNLCSKAIAILEDSDARFYVDMTEALKSGRACAVLADSDGVLIHVPDCIWYKAATIENIQKSVGILSTETLIANHPWTKAITRHLICTRYAMRLTSTT